MLASFAVGQGITDRDLRAAATRSGWITAGRDYAETRSILIDETFVLRVNLTGGITLWSLETVPAN